jgi:hypothetical protein
MDGAQGVPAGLKVGMSGGLCRVRLFVQDIVQRLPYRLSSGQPYGCRPLQLFVVGVRDALPLYLFRFERPVARVPDPLHDVRAHVCSFLNSEDFDAPQVCAYLNPAHLYRVAAGYERGTQSTWKETHGRGDR